MQRLVAMTGYFRFLPSFRGSSRPRRLIFLQRVVLCIPSSLAVRSLFQPFRSSAEFPENIRFQEVQEDCRWELVAEPCCLPRPPGSKEEERGARLREKSRYHFHIECQYGGGGAILQDRRSLYRGFGGRSPPVQGRNYTALA